MPVMCSAVPASASRVAANKLILTFFEQRGLRRCEVPTRVPCFQHCHCSWFESQPAQGHGSAFGSECGLRSEVNVDCMLVLLQWDPHYIQSAYIFSGGTAPGGYGLLFCVQQSPTNAGPAMVHPMPFTPASFPAMPVVFVGHRLENIPGALASCLLPLDSCLSLLPLSASKCLCLASARAGLGWAAGYSPQHSLLNIPRALMG